LIHITAGPSWLVPLRARSTPTPLAVSIAICPAKRFCRDEVKICSSHARRMHVNFHSSHERAP
jgi:hypothetical protein